MTTADFLTDLMIRRGNITVGGNPNRFIELADGIEVTYSAFEPDAQTFRDPYYYNTRQNALYKKITFNNKSYWKLLSEC